MMGQIRRNTNYVLNESGNMKFIDQKVSEILQEPVNTMPHNFISLFNAKSMPQINHCVLKLPGNFRRLEATNGFTWKGENIYVDQSITANYPNASLYPVVAINTEYFIGRLQKKDKKRLLKYSLNSSCKLHAPCFTVAAINYEPYTLEEIAYVEDHPL